MKRILKYGSCFLLVWIAAMASCKKEKVAYTPPVARAGEDTTILLGACHEFASARLDASASRDPEGTALRYNWYCANRSNIVSIASNISAITKVSNLPPGTTEFVLTVFDGQALYTRDTVLIHVVAPPPAEYELDISFDAFFKSEVVVDCFDYYYGTDCDHPYIYRFTEITGTTEFPPIGRILVRIGNTNDGQTLLNGVANLNAINGKAQYLDGTCNVNFGKLVEQGGGMFTGDFQLLTGSADACDPNVISRLPALTITGNMDTTAKTCQLRIKGKAVF